MADAKREYQANFTIGARLAGSFRGTMAVAQARLRSLATTSKRVMGVMGSMLSGFKGLFAMLGTFAAGAVIGKIFGDAVKEAQEAEDRTRALTAALMRNEKMRRAGMEVAKQNTGYIQDANKALEAQGVLSQDHLDNMSKQLAIAGLSPKRIIEANAAMADQLVYAKTARATEEDATGFARAHAKAIISGQVKGLQQYGIYMKKAEQKEIQALAKAGKTEEIHKRLMALYKKSAGENARAMDTANGRLVMFQKTMKNLSQDIGNELMPAIGDMADAWRAVLEDPEIRGMLIGSVKKLAEGISAVANIVKTDLLPMLTAVGESDAFKKLSKTVSDFGKKLKQFLDIGGAIAGAGKPWDEVLFQQRKAAMAGLPGPFMPDISAAEKTLAPMQKLTGLELFKPAVENAKDFNVVTDKLPSSLMPSAQLTETMKAATRDMVDTYTKLPPETLAVAESMANTVDKVDQMVTGAERAVSWFQVLRNLFIDIAAHTPTMGPIQTAAQYSQQVNQPAPAPQPQQFGGIFRRATNALIGEAGPEAVIPLSGGRRAEGLLSYANRVIGMGRPSGAPTNLSFSPIITINGNATEAEQRAMDSRLRDLASDFIAQFKAAQAQERRLSYESGYG